MKNDMDFKKAVIIISLIGFIIFVGILLSMLTSRVSIEGDCSVDNLSFKLNETNLLENLTLSNGAIKCHFKGEGPLLLLMGR